MLLSVFADSEQTAGRSQSHEETLPCNNVFWGALCGLCVVRER